MTESVDVLIVGSGASATSAAYPLTRQGLSVLMLDVGNVDTQYSPLIPRTTFSELRRSDDQQHRYLLGDELEGITFGGVRTGAQLTPPRSFIQKQTEALTPLRTTSFSGIESLALGGLAAGWGGVAVPFDSQDLADYPITYGDLAPHYEAVSARIGISGARDDLLPFYGDCSSLQPPLDLDSGGETILSRYAKRRQRLHRKGVYLGRPRLAVLTRPLGERHEQKYRDMDYYADANQSVFRPAFAVEELQGLPNFRYARPYLVERFTELQGGGRVQVDAKHTETGRVETFRARKLILAAGALGTARIVLRSLDRYGTPVPLLTNPYTYVPCINTAMLGKIAKDRRHSLTQLGFTFAPEGSGEARVYGQAYSYRSLLLFKLAKESALPVPASFRLARDLLSSFVIFGIHHEDRPSAEKHCILHPAKNQGVEVLEVNYKTDAETERRQGRAEKILLRSFRELGCWPVKRIHPGHGSSIHYGGTIPMIEEGGELTVTPSCRLRGTKSVYLADGSVLPYLPAKALTLTLMANAERVGTIVSKVSS